MKLNAKETCLIVIDMLNDFVRKDGALVVQNAEGLIPFQNQILLSARDAGIRVIYLADNHEPNDDEFEKWPAHAIVGTKGSKIIDELKPLKDEKILPKRRYSGFFGTDLDLRLRENGIKTIILVGVLTDICVMYTSADASARGYEVIVIKDATDSNSTRNHEFAIEHMKSVHGALIMTTNEITDMLNSL